MEFQLLRLQARLQACSTNLLHKGTVPGTSWDIKIKHASKKGNNSGDGTETC